MSSSHNFSFSFIESLTVFSFSSALADSGVGVALVGLMNQFMKKRREDVKKAWRTLRAQRKVRLDQHGILEKHRQGVCSKPK